MEHAKISEKPEVKLHFLDYWRVVRMRKSLILTVFLLVVATTALMTYYLLPSKYCSTVQIEVKKDAPEIGLTESRYSSDYFDPYFLNTQFQILKSTLVLNQVISNLDLCKKLANQMRIPNDLSLDDAYDVLSKRIKVDQTHSTSLIEVTVYDSDNVQAMHIANKIAEVYASYRQGYWTNSRAKAIESFRADIAQCDSNLIQKENEQYRFLATNKIPIADDGMLNVVTIYTESLRRFEAERVDAQTLLITDSNLLAKLEPLPRERRKDAIPVLMPPDSTFTSLQQDLATAQQKFVQISAHLGTNHPDYVAAKSILDSVQKQLDDKIDGIIEGLKQRVASEKDKLTNLQTAVESATDKATETSEQFRPYSLMKRDVEAQRQESEHLKSRLQAEETEFKQLAESVRVINYAKVGQEPVSPNKSMNMALGIIVGLIVGVGLAFFIEYLDTSVKTIDDVERFLDAQVLSVIPQHVGVLLDEGMDSPHAEAYRVLRTNLLFARKDESWNTVTVLSGGAGEGKSTTLFNLATVFAQSGSRVLVVDSDLNRPSIHKMLRVSNSIGLTDCLLNKAKLEDAIQTTQQENLNFLPSGKLPRTSMGILSSIQMKELIKEVKGRYDYVFFDSPPLLGVSDAAVLASLMDMTLQVIQYRRYPQLMTVRAKQMITKVGGHLMGIVLNNINMSQDENYYYYSGYYGYYQYKYKPDAKDGKEGAEGKGPKTGEDASKKTGGSEIKPKY